MSAHSPDLVALVVKALPVDPIDDAIPVRYHSNGIPIWGTPQSVAEKILDALAGRLLPEPLETEWGWAIEGGGPISMREEDARHHLIGYPCSTLHRRPVGPWVPVDACPTCSGPVRETVGMACQTCGTDYSPKPDPIPCPEGFHWLGQSFAHCDLCPFPAWEHEGMATPAQEGPFSSGWVLKPWEPGEREAVKAKWGPRVPVDPKDGQP